MHLWPSMRLRDSFKINYLKKIEWNLHKMNIEKQQRNQSLNGNQQTLLENDKIGSGNSGRLGIGLVCREVFMVLSCCYCCFCCGACIDGEEAADKTLRNRNTGA